MERVKEAFEAGIDSIDEYKLNKTRILKRIAELEDERPQPSEEEVRTSLILKAGEVLSRLKSEGIVDNDKNELLRSIVSKIIFNKKNQTIQIFYNPN